jgi:hypothetical protein
MKIIKCENCGIEFLGRNNKKVCSMKCHHEYVGKKIRKVTEIINCPICGKEIQRRPSDIKFGLRKYCSNKCRNEAGSKIIKCEFCKKELKIRKCDNRKYCNFKCYASYLETLIGKKAPRWNDAKIKYEKFLMKWKGEPSSVITYKTWKRAEDFAEIILIIEGFYDILRINNGFDYYARKKGDTYGFDVTTSIRKPIRKKELIISKYFGLIPCILTIKPDLTKYKITKVENLKSVNIHSFKNFKEVKYESDT